MEASYVTIQKEATAEIVIEKSRFITYMGKAETVEEVHRFIDRIKAEHPLATHHCWAYITGEGGTQQKANDDGEPSGTAGRPILEVLVKQGLRDTVCVVVRYFGGIKLGAGGLIRAYSQAAKEGVLAAGLAKKSLHRKLSVTIDYPWLGSVEKAIQQRGRKIADITYLEKVTLTLYCPLGMEEEDQAWLRNLTNGQAELSLGGHVYLEEPLP